MHTTIYLSLYTPTLVKGVDGDEVQNVEKSGLLSSGHRGEGGGVGGVQCGVQYGEWSMVWRVEPPSVHPIVGNMQ